jgi:hypothetical protein
MKANSLSRDFAQLSTPLIVDDLLSVAQEIWQREREQAQEIKSGRSLQGQLSFAQYLEKRPTNSSSTFREPLRKISGAIEE